MEQCFRGYKPALQKGTHTKTDLYKQVHDFYCF